jgi:GNAT superfamily N-acetyltransferase
MNIRNATYMDAPIIKSLLEALGYTATVSLLINQLELAFGQHDHKVFVYELKKEVVGFISIHFLPQLPFAGELVVISYLSVDEAFRGRGVDKALEQYVSEQAAKRKCSRIQAHCQEWQTPAHQFYREQGYQEFPKFFVKQAAFERKS